jgi:FkbM family methyltransferase
MEDFYVIGSHELGFRVSSAITSLPQCKGMVDTDIHHNRFMSSSYRQRLSGLQTIPLLKFLRHAKKNPGTVLVSFYDFYAGHMFVKKLESLGYGIKVVDWYNFCLENNLQVLFTPAKEEREKVLSATDEWARFRKELTDDFSQFSLDCYLDMHRTKNRAKLLPAYVLWDHKFVNPISRKLSLVPEKSEIVVDVGAWNGDTVTKYLEMIGTYKSIHAFEPNRKIFPKLKEREFYIDKFYTYPMAVSNFTGELEFFLGGHEASRIAELAVPDGSATERVPCTKLDDVLDEATILKIEVEGHEPEVVQGAARLIKKCKPDMCVEVYHFPLDPIRVMDEVSNVHNYKYKALRFHAIDQYLFSMYFSDRAPFA